MAGDGTPHSAGGPPDAGVVERYLAAVVDHDWDGLRGCVAADVVRVGPFGDSYRGREDYVGFIAALLPTLPGYAMRVDRVAYTSDRRLAIAELTETVDVGGSPHVTPEVLVFDLDPAGAIARITIYIQRLGEAPALAADPRGGGAGA